MPVRRLRGPSHCEDAQCVCDAGYEAGADGACVDVDECADNNGGCPKESTCVNVAGGAPTCEGPSQARWVLSSSLKVTCQERPSQWVSRIA